MSAFKIVDGPSKWDLMISLFSATREETKKVVFKIQKEDSADHTVHVLEVGINSVSQEDGSGESWMFSGYYTEKLTRSPRVAKGWYRTDRRHGRMEM